METRDHLLLRIGAMALVVGSVFIFIFRTLRGHLPAEEGGAATLNFVASYPIYRAVHLGDVLGFVMFASGLLMLSESLTHQVAWVIGRLGVASVLIGAAVHITEFSIDGYALTTLAQIWSVASAAERPHLEFAADVAVTMLGGPATMSLSMVWGTTLILYGLALNKEGYPRWLGWTGAVVGTFLFAMAIAKFLRPSLFPGVILYGGGTWAAHLWTRAVAAAMWRRAGTLLAGNGLPTAG